MEDKKTVRNFSIMLFMASSSYALINVQVIPFLTKIGYSPEQRGVILAASAMLSIVGQLFAGYYADKHGTIKRIYVNMTVVLIGAAFVGYAIDAHNFWFHFTFIVLATGVFRVCSNLLETWILGKDSVRDHFGLIRGSGSVGWALTSLISAFIIALFGYIGVAVVFGVISILIIAQSRRIGDIDGHKESVKLTWSDLVVLVKNQRFVLLVVVFTLANFIMNADSILVTDYIFKLGGTEKDVGFRWLIQGLVELPAFYFGNKLIDRIGGKRFVLITLFFLVLRFTLYSQSTTINQIIWISLLQMVTFPFLITAQRFLIYRESPDTLKSSGQMVASSMILSVSSIVTPLVAGYLTRFFNYQDLLLYFGLVGIMPFILMFMYKERKQVYD